MADNGYAVDWGNCPFPGIAPPHAIPRARCIPSPSIPRPPCSIGTRDPFTEIGKNAAPKTWGTCETDMKALEEAAATIAPMAIDISADESWRLMEQFSAIHNQPIATRQRL